MNKRKGKTIKPIIAEFYSEMLYCVSLSWKASRFYTLVRVIGRIITPIFGIISTYLLKYIIDLLSGSWQIDNKITVLIALISGTLILALFSVGIQKGVQYCQTMHSEILSKQITMQMMDKTLGADLEFFDNTEYYNKLSAASRDSSSVVNILWNVLECASSCIVFVSAFILLCGSNLFYGISVLLAAFPAAIAGSIYTKTLYKLSIDQIEGEREKMYIQGLSSYRQYAQDIRLFETGNYLKDRYIRLWQSLFDDRRKILRKRSTLTGILEFLPEIVLIGIAVNVSFRILAGIATIGDYMLYAGIARQLYSSILTLSNSAIKIYDDKLRIKNIQTLNNFKNSINNTGTQKLEKVGTIEFCNVSFCYPSNTNKVLENVSFKVDEGEKIAIVGINGSGKSTLIKLLLRFYDIDTGSIRINNIDIREFDLHSLRSNFSVYFQDMLNYSFSLRENIEIADLDRDDGDEPILQAIIKSCSEEILDRAPNKLDTYITHLFRENGIELSGGQQQKIALARTFYRRHTSLILDEPSSHLDSEAEYKVFEALKQLCSGKTTLFTSHRLSNVALADRIIVIENGRIIEQGTQAELLKNPNRFAKLFKYQQDKYMEVVK